MKGLSTNVAVPVVAAAIGLVGALVATLSLHRVAAGAVDRVLHERLIGAGESAAALLDAAAPGAASLQAVMRSNELDAVYVVSPELRIIADASGPAGRRADLLRIDARRVRDALAGGAQVAPGYALGTLTVMTGYFPIGRPDGGSPARSVLVLEAGQVFVAAQGRVTRARNVAVLLALLSALGLAVVAARFTRAERGRQQAASYAARGELLSRLAAMAAHEIRNPLGVIRGTVDLMRERSRATLTERDRQSLDDVAAEVERLRGLTQDLLTLASDRPLALGPTDLGGLLGETARATEAAFPRINVHCEGLGLPTIHADPALLRQLFANLFANAAQAQSEGEITVAAQPGDGDGVKIAISDRGPGVPPDVGDRIFELYFTTKSGGTGLGLAIARRIVERHGGTLTLRRDGRPGAGATFLVTLPGRPPIAHNPPRG
jgi:two-component system OmpR family sensor kinase